MLTGTDDDVLDPAGNVEVAAGHIPAIAGVEPAVMEQLACLGRILEIARRRRWTAEFKATFLALAELATHLIDDADFVIGNRMPASDDFDGVGVIRLRGLGDPARA